MKTLSAKLRFIRKQWRLLTAVLFVSASVCAGDLKPAVDGLSARITVSKVSACGNGSDGSIVAIPQGGTAPYNFQWSGPNGFSSQAEAVYNLPIGYYQLILSDADGLLFTVDNIHVSRGALPYITWSGNNDGTCLNHTGSLTVYATAAVSPYTYSMDGVNFQASNFFNNINAGTYTIYAKDARGCTGSTIATLGSAPALTISPYVQNATACNNDGLIKVYRTGGTPPYSYSMDGINYQVSNAFTDLAPAGGLRAYVKDSRGCVIVSGYLTVGRNPGLNITTSKTNSSACTNDGTISIRATGGNAPYNYSLDGISYYPTATFTNLAQGTYTCYVRDVKGCNASSSAVTINSNQFSGYATVNPNNSCNMNGKFVLHPNPGGTSPYVYSLDDQTYSNNNVFGGLAGGTYSGWIKDAKGCRTQVTNIVVPEGAGINVSASRVHTSTCVNNGSITVSANGGTAPYSFKMGNGTYGTNPTFTQLGSGNYVLFAKDALGCEGSVNATINVIPILVTVTTTPVSGCGVTDGSISIYRTGGTGTIRYSIDGNNYQSSNVFTGLEEGTYDAYVKDENVCIGVATNVEVHSDCISRSGENSQRTVAAPASVSISPNPSASFFTLNMRSNYVMPVSLVVVDMYGRAVWRTSTTAPGSIRFGSSFAPGVYRVMIIKDGERETISVVKN
jgi:hypothetical protein